MRYVFIALLFIIVLRSYFWLYKEHMYHKKEIQSLPDAGLVGEIVRLDTNATYPLPHEATMGSSRACDIRVKSHSVKSLHVTLRFEEKRGIRVVPNKHAHVTLDDQTVAFGAHYALHGSVMLLNDVPFRFRLFQGLEVPVLHHFKEDDISEEDFVEDAFYEEEDFIENSEDMDMTWAYAYNVDDLNQAMDAQNEASEIPYQEVSDEEKK